MAMRMHRLMSVIGVKQASFGVVAMSANDAVDGSSTGT